MAQCAYCNQPISLDGPTYYASIDDGPLCEKCWKDAVFDDRIRCEGCGGELFNYSPSGLCHSCEYDEHKYGIL